MLQAMSTLLFLMGFDMKINMTYFRYENKVVLIKL
jgi:hypothetical protein